MVIVMRDDTPPHHGQRKNKHTQPPLTGSGIYMHTTPLTNYMEMVVAYLNFLTRQPREGAYNKPKFQIILIFPRQDSKTGLPLYK
jgi:hypothetical protein